jgi:hypothetical protein
MNPVLRNRIHDIFGEDQDPDPCLWLMDPDSDPDSDPDPTIFIIDLQDANKKLI